MLVVVVFHTLLWVITVEGGQLRIYPWAPGPVYWALSWPLAVVPVFFVAAGYANAVVVDTWHASKENYGAFLARRGTRLLGPMSLYGAFFIAFGTVAAWSGWPVEAATLSRQFAQLLWFAICYQLLLAAAPAAVWLHDRLRGLELLPLLAAAIAVDVAVRATGRLDLQWLNLAFVWPLTHQLGIAYHRGWFRTWSPAVLWAGLGGTAAVIAGLVFGLGYPPAAVAWADVLVANLLPPTMAVAVLGLAQTLLLALLQQAGVAASPGRTAQRVVPLVNALSLTIYLWHIPAIVIAGGALAGLSLLLPALSTVLLNRVLLVALVLAIVAAACPWLARIELRLVPALGARPPRRGAMELGYAGFCLGSFALWQTGGVLHPATPGPALAALLFGAGVLGLRIAVGRTREATG